MDFSLARQAIRLSRDGSELGCSARCSRRNPRMTSARSSCAVPQGVFALVPALNDRQHWIEVGRCYERFALHATTLGICTAFPNQPIEVAPLRSQFATWLGPRCRGRCVARLNRSWPERGPATRAGGRDASRRESVGGVVAPYHC
jgi:hypothetical protein